MTTKTPAKSAPTAEQREAFLTTFASGGHEARAAEAAGITLAAVRALARSDAEFKAARADAREAHRALVYDAIMEEAVLGRETVDPVNGKVTRTRNLRLLERLGIKHGVIDPDRPAVAVQNNVTGISVDPKDAASAQENAQRLRELIKRGVRRVIDVQATPAESGDDDDLL